MAKASPTKDRTPNRSSNAFDCPRCGVFTHQTWFDLQREIHDNYSGESWHAQALDSPGALESEGLPASYEQGSAHEDVGRWAMAQCGRCWEYSVWRGEQMIFPAGSPLAPLPHEQMPAEGRELYVEASQVVGISRRAGAALARAALERTLRSLRPYEGKQPDLARRIEDALPYVSAPLGKMLTLIRHVGNKSLHVEDVPDDAMLLILDPKEAEVVEIIFASINELVEELVARPARLDSIYEKIPTKVRQQVPSASAD